MLVKSRDPLATGINVVRYLNGYSFVSKISSGTFGEVKLYRKNGVDYAVKKFTNKKMGAIHLTTLRELRTLMTLDGCPYIIKVTEIIVTRTDILVVFPYHKETLTNKKYEKMKELKEHFRELVVGLKCMHDRGLMHRDLKSANILLDGTNSIRIIDFGMSRPITHLMTSMVCTLWYRAPELLEYGEKNVYAKYSTKVDIWSIGIILLEMLLGYAPCKSNSEVEQYKIIRRDLSDMNTKFYFLDETVKNLLIQMLKIDPRERIGIEEILQHPFITSDAHDNDKVVYLTESNVTGNR